MSTEKFNFKIGIPQEETPYETSDFYLVYGNDIKSIIDAINNSDLENEIKLELVKSATKYPSNALHNFKATIVQRIQSLRKKIKKDNS